MANLPGIRIRDNGVFGTTIDNPLTSGAVAFNSLGLVPLSAVSGDHAMITLDPVRQYGNPEIVMVTAHTAAASVATIQRGMYGTTARSHPQGTLWTHSADDQDFVEILTSATRPADPYRGQKIFETDTNSFVARDTSDVWQTVVQLGQWISWTPTLTNITQGNGTLVAKYTRIARTIHYLFSFIMGSTSAMGSVPTFTLPVAPSSDYVINGDVPMGQAHLIDAGVSGYLAQIYFLSGSSVGVRVWNSAGTYVVPTNLSSTVPFTWGTGDFFAVNGTYEAAS